MSTVIYVEPPGLVLKAGPLRAWGRPPDRNFPSFTPPPNTADNVVSSSCKPDYTSKTYQSAYVVQVGANYGNVGATPVQSIHRMTTEPALLGNGPKTTPQFNLLQPIPYWNVKIVTAKQLASYESNKRYLVTQVPVQYNPSGTPNLYLGK